MSAFDDDRYERECFEFCFSTLKLFPQTFPLFTTVLSVR